MNSCRFQLLISVNVPSMLLASVPTTGLILMIFDCQRSGERTSQPASAKRDHISTISYCHCSAFKNDSFGISLAPAVHSARSRSLMDTIASTLTGSSSSLFYVPFARQGNLINFFPRSGFSSTTTLRLFLIASAANFAEPTSH